MRTPHEHFLQRNDVPPPPRQLSRRNLLGHCGQLAWAAPALWLLGGCAGRPPVIAAAAAGVQASPPGAAWATGGTAHIGVAVRSINPFADASASLCRLTCEATIGPCHTLSPERRDISDGWNGLPMHIRLRIVDPDCRPVEGAIVEIWHTNHTGGYSGDIVQMCNNNAQDLKRQFFRGWQRTGADGTVAFDTCYPGWYSSRANHVHIRVLKGDYDPDDSATAWIITQLLFPDALNTAIFGSEPLYRDKGQPDTTLATDNVVGQEADASPYLFDVRNVEGVMLASKTLSIRNSLQDAVCAAQGAQPPGGPGGPPGGPDGRRGPPPDGMRRPQPR